MFTKLNNHIQRWISHESENTISLNLRAQKLKQKSILIAFVWKSNFLFRRTNAEKG